MFIKYNNSVKKEKKIKEKLKSIYSKTKPPSEADKEVRRRKVKGIIRLPLSFMDIIIKGGPDEIINRCETIERNIKGIIKESKWGSKYPHLIEEEISKEIITGYFMAASELLDKSNKTKKTKKNREEKYNKWFKQGFDLYQKYPHKEAFTEILNYINFKTGPLSEEDIRLTELYYRELHREASSGIKYILGSTGCFGICGPRGIGKSTLLNAVVEKSNEKLKGPKKPLTVKLTVPTKYKADEFLTTLLSKICEEVKDEIKRESFMRIIITFKDLKIKILSIVIIGLVFLAIHGLPEVMNLPNIINYIKNIPISHYTVIIILILLIFLLTNIVFDKIKIYDYVSRIYEDLKFKKTVEISRNMEYSFLNIGRRTTFEKSPINYTEPALSAEITETIEKITKKTFSKVIIIIDDIDKLEEEEDPAIILKSIRFLSSAKNCLALLSVRERLQEEFSNPKSEVRTLFADIIVLKGIEDEGIEDLKQLIAHRIINKEVGDSFLDNQKIITNKNKFLDDLLCKSGGIPREAFRWFDRSFRRWLVSDEPERTIDDEFYDIKSLSSKIEEDAEENIGYA